MNNIHAIDKKMKIILLLLPAIFLLPLLGFSESLKPSEDRKKVEFFEKLYGTNIKGIKPLGEYHDPDTFYSEIAKQVGIPEIVYEAVEKELGWELTHVYGLTETAPLITVCEPLPEHNGLSVSERARIKACQGVELVSSGELKVVLEDGSEVSRDGQTLGEIVVRGNVVMAIHGNFRNAMAAPAEMPEFKGNVFAVRTAKFWDMRLKELEDKQTQVKQMAGFLKSKHQEHANKDGSMSAADQKEYLEKFRKKLISEEEEAYAQIARSNGGYHYYGSAKTMAQIGKAFAEALVGK